MLMEDVVTLEEPRDPAHAVMVVCSTNGMVCTVFFVSVELAVPGL